jgi:hypothetical protein
MAFGNRPLPCTLRNTNGRPLANGLAPAAVYQANHGNCCNGHRENHPGEAERSVVGTNPFQSEGQIDRIEQRVAGRHAKLGGRFKTTSSTGETRSVIRSKSGRPPTALPVRDRVRAECPEKQPRCARFRSPTKSGLRGMPCGHGRPRDFSTEDAEATGAFALPRPAPPRRHSTPPRFLSCFDSMMTPANPAQDPMISLASLAVRPPALKTAAVSGAMILASQRRLA